jgi:hypothetical protein
MEHARDSMATPGQLVKWVATALNIPEPTVVQYDRLLAESGLRSKGGRGTSAAKVTAVDAANLLIAILGSPVAGASIKPAIEVCKTYGRLRAKLGGDTENMQTFRRLGLSTVSKLPTSHSLRDGIAAVIEGAKVGDTLIIPDEEEGPFVPQSDSYVSITLNGPAPWAEILADASFGEATPSKTGRLVYHNNKRDRDGRWARADSGDLHQSRSITFKTIRQIGDLLAGISK